MTTAAEINARLEAAEAAVIALRKKHAGALHRGEWVQEVASAEQRAAELDRDYTNAQRAELASAAEAYRKTGKLPTGFGISRQATGSTGELWEDEA